MIIMMRFNDLPDELVKLMIDHHHPGFDHRSRILAQDTCRELLIAHEHDSLVTQRIMDSVCWLPTDHLKYYTFLQKLKRYLSPAQLMDIANCPLSERISRMALLAQ